jgi:hypothetical protein
VVGDGGGEDVRVERRPDQVVDALDLVVRLAPADRGHLVTATSGLDDDGAAGVAGAAQDADPCHVDSL